MSDRRARLTKRATERTRKPDPAQLKSGTNQKQGYRVVPVSLYTPEAEWIDQLAAVLKKGWSPKANRSLVVREAIHRLKDELDGKSPDEVLRYFVERHVQRAGGGG